MIVMTRERENVLQRKASSIWWSGCNDQNHSLSLVVCVGVPLFFYLSLVWSLAHSLSPSLPSFLPLSPPRSLCVLFILFLFSPFYPFFPFLFLLTFSAIYLYAYPTAVIVYGAAVLLALQHGPCAAARQASAPWLRRAHAMAERLG